MLDSTRPTWDDTWLEVARVIAKRSLCERDQVGAVIVTRDNRIVATGYNGPPSGFKHDGAGCSSWCTRAMYTVNHLYDTSYVPERDYSDCPSLHAEANALSVCDRSVRVGGTIYVTGGMCFPCAKLVANSGLVQVVIDEAARPAEHRNSENSYRFLESCGLTVVTG